jgi:hypothetical protein
VLLECLDSQILIADKAYDADERVIKRLEEAGKTAVIPQGAIELRHEAMMSICTKRVTLLRTFLHG